MKRVSVIVLAAAAVVLAGCGSDESSEGNGLRQSSTTSGAASPTAATSAAPGTKAPVPNATAETANTQGSASQTTCGEFKTLDPEAEKALIAQILAENPGSPFEGNPSNALGTAKLVCLQESKADAPVAVVAGLVR